MKRCIRVIAAVLLIAASLGTVGCDSNTKKLNRERDLPKRFEYVDDACAGTNLSGVRLNSYDHILVDTLTGVLYLYKEAGYLGGITVLVDANGMPLTLDGGQHED